jgi:hypothetical protein
MPTLFALLLLLAADQSPVPATFISKEDHEAVLKKQVADNVVDQPIKASDVPGGKASVAMLHRVKPGDIIIVPAGTPHNFSVLDGPISYLLYRFEPTQKK